MSKYLKIGLLALLIAPMAYAQPGGQKMKREKVEAMRIAYITEHVEITPSEAEKFWPLYNEYMEKNKSNKDAMRDFHQKMRSNERSDKELEELMMQRFDTELAELELKKEYHQKYMKLLSATKVAKLYHAEQEFKRVLVRELRDEAKERRQNVKDEKRNKRLFTD